MLCTVAENSAGQQGDGGGGGGGGMTLVETVLLWKSCPVDFKPIVSSPG